MFTFFMFICLLMFIAVVHGSDISEYYANKTIQKLKNRNKK